MSEKPDKPPKFKSKLTVKSQSVVGTFMRGDNEVTIYGVEAVNEQGVKVDKKLRTFHEDLPLDVLEEFEVEPYEHKDFGVTYTLKLLTKGRASKKDITELTRQITDLASRVSALEEQYQGLRAEQQRRTGIDREMDEKFGEKAPWDIDD